MEDHPLLTVKAPIRAMILTAIFLTGVAGQSAFAQDAKALRRAISLFEDSEYLASQEVLTGINSNKLDARQQALRDVYLNRVQVAITMYEKALRDLEDAETAINDQDHDRAENLLNRVLSNEYAAHPVHQSAQAMFRQLRGEPPTVTPHRDQPETTRSTLPANQISTQDAQRARVLTHEADQMTRAGKFDEARRLYQQALSLVPGYPDAANGMAQLEQHAQNAVGTRADSLIERIRRRDRINWQRTMAEYRDVETMIREHVNNNRYENAHTLLVRAQQIVESGKQFADPIANYESLRQEHEKLADFVDGQERNYNEKKVAEIRQQIAQDRATRIKEDRENRNRQVDALMSQAMQHRKDGDITAAINVLQQISVIDPKFKTARWMMDELEDARQFQRGRDIRNDFYDQSQQSLLDVEESKIPWHQDLRYPKDWAEIITRPERNFPRQTTRDRHLFGALDRKIPVDFRQIPFDQVIDHLVDSQQLNIIVSWHDLMRAGVKKNTLIDLHLPREITLKKAITEILDQAGAGTVSLGFDISEGAIKIATQDTIDRQTYTAVYDINDLLMEIPMFNDSPMRDLNQANQRAAANRAAESSRSLWNARHDDNEESEENPQRQSRVQKIINLIQETIAPNSWIDRGGRVGSIKEINGQLVVTQNTATQRGIGNLLGTLREQRAIQISVEARFVTVSSHYLEELGIDIDIVLNSGNAGFDFLPAAGGGAITDPVTGAPLLLPRTFSRLGFTPTVPNLGGVANQTPFIGGGSVGQPFGIPGLIPQRGGGGGSQLTPIPIATNILGITNPANLGSDVPGSFAGQIIGPALSIFGSFLDNIQVDFLIRATQADSRTSILTAPRLVLFNGQRSWVAVTVQQNFVSTLNPVVAAGAVAQAPTVGTIDSGAVLDVTATVSADKRYVTMTLRPGITRLLALQTIPFSGGAGGGGFGGGTALNAFIQVPTLSSQRVQTTVSVPDGGTLLIGGQKLASETEIEAGVPILSKIPILKRAYSSRSLVKDEQTLLILIKPKIFIQSEQEEFAFPSFGPR